MNLIPVNIVNVKSVIINHNAQRGRDTMKEDVTGKPEYSIPRDAYQSSAQTHRQFLSGYVLIY